ncbi:histidine--tRNA ligase [candidate division WOR-1 bacterium RIFOXYA12_FULL_43_27]|uniref:Histidine--tRNA ligase n=1 Tax=candidate division WOR-1 bacterium RIFOXYC2_FULL_46_14 TaxID=1802587 RepID=A0A1F4U731_UNCSA|nr:MAG: histidine--tRNA ligase [candidate division WOR-1 bacterium RIFOXYA12_FULL_43_27]OGC19575.1 MAG: histidine--tRNA ligase [candidate division WOR-1 bacterium RIFOXYB2_FULL_46_45]OGC30563.1 MAG: histidine--tRNA ligase [candidate division WOR-1 bacterium RIFOXYA2_FULL_46_56]OGC40630.1 MAG: histidine--tRNA ligase [candidate division WOR-1 bacterium RIFOXYC2_FULL_46_14]
MKYQSLRGMKDILPEEAPLWQKIEAACSKKFQQFNYQEIRTPIMEMTELFARAVGQSTDIVSKEMYSFTDKGNRNVVLRPEGTAPIVRACLEHNLISKDKITKLYYFGPMFRYERPQAGRYRQFHQVGIEAFGSADPALDAETILLAVSIFKDLGLTDLEVDLNSVGCKECRPRFDSRLRAYLKGFIVQMCEDCHIRYKKNPLRILDCKKPTCQNITNEILQKIGDSDYLCADCKDHFEKLKSILDSLSVNYKINKRLVRGLDYYTKTTYEVISSSLGAQNAVCGGGRYDNLVEDFGGSSVPAVGFAIGMERLVEIMKLKDQNAKLKANVQLYIAPLGEEAKSKAVEYLQKAREAGISADMDYQDKKLKAQLKIANAIGAKYVLILGDDELKKNIVVLRDMQANSQEEITFEEVLARIR